MALSSGVHLGPYEIVELLGAGGMGEVYRAIDRRLNRAVAIKMVAARHRDRPDLHQRFKVEMAAIAALNHPHICRLYDVGEHEGAGYLVMELVEGETLAARLARGRLPMEQTLRIGSEIAAALDAAHRRGILHRDLKPANVMLTKAGVKLLDFGVARMRPPDHATVAALTTVAADGAPLTEVGTPLGTWQYMAPEQIRGGEVDARTDIFALGVVLYEMVAGQHPFVGSTHGELIEAIVNADPTSIATAHAGASSSVDRVVRKCLAKDPDARWQHAGDLATQLRWLNDVSDARDAPASASRRSSLLLMALLAGLFAATAVWILKPTAVPAPAQRVHFTLELPPGTELPSIRTVLALSPDGRQLAFTGLVDGETRLFIHDLEDHQSRAVEGTSGASAPFFSPDGEWVGFSSRAGLQAVSIRGGVPFTVSHLSSEGRAAWGCDDRILFASSNRASLVMWERTSGTSRPITTLNASRGETSHRFPEFLPGCKGIVYTVGPPAVGPWYEANIVAQALGAAESSVVIRGAAQARYSSTGHLVYARAGTLAAVPFDIDAMRVTGAAVKVLEGVREDPSQGTSQFALSRNGTLAYIPGSVYSNELVWTDRRGQPTPLIRDSEPRLYYQPRLSPDARQLAITVAGGNDDLWLYDIGHEVLTRFTSGANHLFPTWTPDGGRLTFYTSDTRNVLWQPADRTTAAELLIADREIVPQSWSPDGRILAYTEYGAGTGSDIWLLHVEDGRRQALMASPFSEVAPMISPDGRWLAYTSDESGRFEVYVVPFPHLGKRLQLSHEGRTEPLWSRDGRELFFRQDKKLMAVATGPSFSRPTALFEAAWWSSRFPSRTNYDVAPDGERFVLLRATEGDERPRIHVIVNWAEGMKRAR